MHLQRCKRNKDDDTSHYSLLLTRFCIMWLSENCANYYAAPVYLAVVEHNVEFTDIAEAFVQCFNKNYKCKNKTEVIML